MAHKTSHVVKLLASALKHKNGLLPRSSLMNYNRFFASEGKNFHSM